MRLIGLLSYFDERASWLRDCITTYTEAGITHLVAVDGSYALYPDPRHRSHPDARDAVLDTCINLGIPVLYHEPDTKWQGGEVEKRATMFTLAEHHFAQPMTDWYIVMDADERVTRALHSWTHELENTELDAGDVRLTETEPRDTDAKAQVDRMFPYERTTGAPIRKLFRAIPGLTVQGNHYTYVDPSGRKLWGQVSQRIVPGLDLTGMVEIDHLTQYRSLQRRAASMDYYQRRDRTGIET